MIKKIFKISGMHCSSCSLVIEGELEDIGAKAKSSYAKQVVEVEWNEKTLKEEQIKAAIEKQGYRIVA